MKALAADSLSVAVSRINSKLESARLPERYMIKPRLKTGRISHNWLAVSPEHIVIEE